MRRIIEWNFKNRISHFMEHGGKGYHEGCKSRLGTFTCARSMLSWERTTSYLPTLLYYLLFYLVSPNGDRITSIRGDITPATCNPLRFKRFRGFKTPSWKYRVCKVIPRSFIIIFNRLIVAEVIATLCYSKGVVDVR